MASYGQIAGSFGRLNNFDQQFQKGDKYWSEQRRAIAMDPNQSKSMSKQEKEDALNELEYQKKWGRFYY